VHGIGTRYTRHEDDMEHKLLEFDDSIVSHRFKSIVACVLVGEV
jgi:hypothetical protein